MCAVAAYLLFRHYAAERAVLPDAVRAPHVEDPAHQR
jgi:hypothetical protein